MSQQATPEPPEPISRLEQRLQAFPVLDAVRSSLVKEVSGIAPAAALNTALNHIATGQITLEQALQQLTHTASTVLETVLQEEQQMMAEATRLLTQYQLNLQRKATRPAEAQTPSPEADTYIVKGQVLHPQTGQPLPGLLVKTLHPGDPQDHLLGVDITDADGNFEIILKAEDFQLSEGQSPAVWVQTAGDQQTLLHTSETPITLRLGEVTTVPISLPEAVIDQLPKGLEPSGGTTIPQSTLFDQTMMFNQIQHAQVEAMGKVFLEGLNQISRFLEQPPEPSPDK
jgi:hypothetical protein